MQCISCSPSAIFCAAAAGPSSFVEVAVETTAFSAVFASHRDKVIMTHKGDFQAGFLCYIRPGRTRGTS